MQCTPETSKLYKLLLMTYMHIFRLITLQSIKNIVDAITKKELEGFILSSRKDTRNKMESFLKLKLKN